MPISDESAQYDIAAKIEMLKSLGRKQYGDGLRMVRLIGPELDPTYNDQIGVAKCQTTEILVCESNRGSKTFSAACRFAAIARDVPLTTWNGEQIDCRPKHHRDRPLTLWLIGYGLSHIGQTMYRLLFEEGQFQMIQDPDTHAWRAWRPWEQWDAENSHKCKPGPPLIPPHEIDHKSWVWENKGDNQFIKVKLTNGTQLLAYPSSGEVKKGDPVHGIWVDELIKYSTYYPEWIMRLTDYEGWLLWSTMIYRNCPALNNRMDAAVRQQEEVERGDRAQSKVITSLFRFKQGGNPYLNKARIENVNREIIGDFGDDEVKQRIDGGSIFDSTLIYPYFDKKFHAAIPDNPDDDDNLARVLRKFNGLPPEDWTHELIIDPGAQKPAVLFCAVPPQRIEFEGREVQLWGGYGKPYFVPYDEIYGKRYSLKELVPIIKQKMRGIRFRRFIIDMQAAQQTPLVGGPPVKSLFSAEFEAHGLESEETGINFIAGDKNFQSRSRIVDGWMQSLQSGKPQLRIVVKRCPNLVWQLAHNQRRMVGEVVLDEEEKRERNDCRVNLEYWASRNPKYVPIQHKTQAAPWVRGMENKLDSLFGKAKSQETRCHFGPGLAPSGAA